MTIEAKLHRAATLTASSALLTVIILLGRVAGVGVPAPTRPAQPARKTGISPSNPNVRNYTVLTTPEPIPGNTDRTKPKKVDDGTVPALTHPTVIARVEPTYTDEARRVHFQDTVSVSITVGEDGRAHDIKFDPPGYGLDEQIIKALHQWKFRPGQKDGKDVAMRATIDITFHSQ